MKPLGGRRGTDLGSGDGRLRRLARKRGASGLTLLEVLIAVFILAIVLSAVYSAYTGNLEVIESAKENGEVQQAARIALDRICRDVESAVAEVPFPTADIQLGMTAVDAQTDGRQTDRIDFTSLSHLAAGVGSPQTDLCEIGYSLEPPAEGEEGFVLLRRDNPFPDGDLTEGGEAMPLAWRIAAFNLSFENGGGETFDSWNSLESGGGLPALVRIELTVLDKFHREHRFVTSVHPALAMPAGQGGD